MEFPVGTLLAAALAMPFRYPRALLKFGLLPLLIALLCLSPAFHFTTTVKVNGVPVGSQADNSLGLGDFIVLLSLPFLAAFTAPWCRLLATGDEAAMGRPPIALDRRTWSVLWAFVRLGLVLVGVGIGAFVLLLVLFGVASGKLSYNLKFNVTGLLPTLGGLLVVLLMAALLLWFMLRLSMIVPASAMGERLSLRESWRMTAPVQFKLLAAAGVLSVLSVLMEIGFDSVALAIIFAAGVTATFYIAVAAYFLVLSYRQAFWAGLLGASYGLLLDSGHRDRAVATVFD